MVRRCISYCKCICLGCRWCFLFFVAIRGLILVFRCKKQVNWWEPVWCDHLKKPGLFRVYNKGLYYPVAWALYIINHFQHPYLTATIMESMSSEFVFSWLMSWLQPTQRQQRTHDISVEVFLQSQLRTSGKENPNLWLINQPPMVHKPLIRGGALGGW